ncbi:MAG: cell division protein FtsA [Deltaproteobacteria bacterium]|nr:cell division protein FtsA [Deltaproteobacteria bacterium]
MPQDLIVGLDIGTTKICAVVGEVRDHQVEIVGVGAAPTAGGLRKGVVVNIDHTVRAIRKAVEEAETIAGCEIRSVYTGVAGSHLQGHNAQGVIIIKGREVTAAEVDRVIESARIMVSIPSDRELIHTLIQEYIIDGQDGIKDPIGIHGNRLECRVHLVSGSVNSLNNIIRCANRAGLEVSGMALQSLACGEAVLTEEEKALGVALVDFGGGTTDVAVFANNSLRYNGSIPVGGNNLTNDIAVGLQTSLNNAEHLKKSSGCCCNALSGGIEEVEIPGLGGRRSRSIPRRELANIVEARLKEIIDLVGVELRKASAAIPVLAGAVISGGSAQIPGLAELFDDRLNLPTRLGHPVAAGGLADVIRDPAYATGVGLVLYGHRLQHPSGDYPTGGARTSKPSKRGLGGRFWQWLKDVV